MYIKRDLISTDWLQIKGEQAIKIICSRFKWESENRLRFVNASNLDCIFEIRTTDPKDEDINARYLELVSAVKIDNEHKNFYRLDSNHFLDQPVELLSNDILERLIRTNQQYKVGLQHALNLKDKSFSLLTKIFGIDYLQKWGDQQSTFDIELSFTWLSWRIVEQIVGETDFNINNIDALFKLQLCVNIWPKGRGVLHKLALGGANEDKRTREGDQVQAF